MYTPHSHCHHACQTHFFTLTALSSVLRHWCASRQHVLIAQVSASVPVLTKWPDTARQCPAMAQPISMSSKGTANVKTQPGIVRQRYSLCQCPAKAQPMSKHSQALSDKGTAYVNVQQRHSQCQCPAKAQPMSISSEGTANVKCMGDAEPTKSKEISQPFPNVQKVAHYYNNFSHSS